MSPFRAFRRPGAWTLAASIGLVVMTGVVTLRYVRTRGPGPPADDAIFEALGSRPLDASALGATPARAAGGADAASPFPDPARVPEKARPSLAVVDETQRGHARGAWSVARKRFDPCPGEDVERTAWIDSSSRILKVSGVRGAGAAAVVVEQWFDHEGRLRAVRAAGAGDERWTVTALLDEGGTVVHRESAGAAPDLASLRLARRDPSGAFFDVPRCTPQKK